MNGRLAKGRWYVVTARYPGWDDKTAYKTLKVAKDVVAYVVEHGGTAAVQRVQVKR